MKTTQDKKEEECPMKGRMCQCSSKEACIHLNRDCDCPTKYCIHYKSDFDTFVEENPKEWIECRKCGDGVVVLKGRVHCFECM